MVETLTKERVKEKILDVLWLAIQKRNIPGIDKVFVKAQQYGITKDKDFIEMAGLIPADIMMDVGITTVYEIPDIGEIELNPQEVIYLSEAIKDGADVMELKDVLKLKKEFKGTILEINKK